MLSFSRESLAEGSEDVVLKGFLLLVRSQDPEAAQLGMQFAEVSELA